MLRLDDAWIWDFWLAEDHGVHHLFFLHAPRELGDPELRHTSAKVGHATSRDLVDWTVHPPALGPGEPGEWDDIATWTGSVVRLGHRWSMYYTGIGSNLGRPIQQIGVAYSDDLFTWRKEPLNPVSTIDPIRYETYPESGWHNQAWRDPWVAPEADGSLTMLVTARVRGEAIPLDERGVVATAHSNHGFAWITGDPVAAPRISGDIEVPQLIEIDGTWFIVFCTVRPSNALASRGVTGCVIGYLRADSPDGLFEWDDDQLLARGDEGLFGPRLVRNAEGGVVMLAWKRVEADGAFGGWVTDPIPLEMRDGTLRRTAL